MGLHSGVEVLLEKAGATMQGRYTVSPRKRVALVRYLYALAGQPILDSCLLDVGCGHGVDCIAAALLGASHVVGIDKDDIGMSHMHRILRSLQQAGREVNVTPMQLDISEGLPFAPDTFDICILIETVSHVYNETALFAEILRVLRPGGALVINDSNNALRRGIIERHSDLWEQWEKGPRPDAEKVPEHERSCEAMRLHIIQSVAPELSEQEARALAQTTTGMVREEILAALKHYQATGEMPDRRYQRGTCPLTPDGVYVERLFDPFELAAQLKTLGFSQTRTFAHLTHGNSLRAFVDTIFRYLPTTLSMPFSRGFIVVAHK